MYRRLRVGTADGVLSLFPNPFTRVELPPAPDPGRQPSGTTEAHNPVTLWPLKVERPETPAGR